MEEVILPDSVTTIGMEAFAHCHRLKDINLGNVETVETAAFFQCKALENLKIPDTLTTIGYSVFAACENLQTVEFPDTLKIIARKAPQVYTPFSEGVSETTLADGICTVSLPKDTAYAILRFKK